MKAIQDIYAPELMCFGCGPKNSLGLQIKSFPTMEETATSLVAHFTPLSHHQAFTNILSGGICGTLLDCHSNWCAAYSLMKALGQDIPPCTVTAKYSVDLLAPTPMEQELKILAKPIKIDKKKSYGTS